VRHMKQWLAVAVVCLLVSPSLFAQRIRAVSPGGRQEPGDALAGLTAAERARFTAGLQQFDFNERADTGLGPVFNEPSCTTCHNKPAFGGDNPGRQVTRIGTIADGKFDPLTRFGGSVLQARGLKLDETPHPFHGEPTPSEATIHVNRGTQPLFGLGLIDATPDSTFIALATDEAARDSATAGRPNMVVSLVSGTRVVGRFGWKAQIATLFEFSGDALLTELGITNPLFPNENCPSGNCSELAFNPVPQINDTGERLRTLTDYMKFLAPVPRLVMSDQALAGQVLFDQLGCGSCHVSTLQTGSSPVAALDHVTYHPYSDFLLHDMGPLGDGIEQESATGREIRTAPLWGVRFRERLLHDRRSSSIDDAIRAHDGQAFPARTRFVALPASDREKVVAFLRTL